MSYGRSEAPYRLNLCKNNPTVRDARWSIYIEERSDSGPTCGLAITHRAHGDYDGWPEEAQEGTIGIILYEHQYEKEYPTAGPAMRDALRFLRRFGAGEVEWLEWDIDNQRCVVVQHTPRDRVSGWYDVQEDRPDPIAQYFPAPEISARERVEAEARRIYGSHRASKMQVVIEPPTWDDLGEDIRVLWREQAARQMAEKG